MNMRINYVYKQFNTLHVQQLNSLCKVLIRPEKNLVCI